MQDLAAKTQNRLLQTKCPSFCITHFLGEGLFAKVCGCQVDGTHKGILCLCPCGVPLVGGA